MEEYSKKCLQKKFNQRVQIVYLQITPLSINFFKTGVK